MSGTTPNLALPYPSSTDTADVPRDIKALADRIDAISGPGGLAMVGEIRMWPAANAPTGWLLCNGQQVTAAANPGLAAVLGQSGGNVTIPDYRDMFPVGAGLSYPLLSTGGAATVLLTATQSGMQPHDHGGKTLARDRSQLHNHVAGSRWMAADVQGVLYPSPGAGMTPSQITIESADPPDHLHGIASQAGAPAVAAHENRPPYRAINFIIRAG